MSMSSEQLRSGDRVVEDGEREVVPVKLDLYTFESSLAQQSWAKERYPRIEEEVKWAAWTFPQGTKPMVFFDEAYEPLFVGLQDGVDVVGALTGGASGAEIAELKKNMKFPTRREEFEAFIAQFPNLIEVWQFQAGGWPFNLGSWMAWRNGDRELMVTTPDVLVEQEEEGMFGARSPFTGIGVKMDGSLEAVNVMTDVRDSEQFGRELVVQLDAYEAVIGSTGQIVRNGEVVSMGHFLGEQKHTGDSRHLVGLPYIGGVDQYGEGLSGSVLMEEMNSLLMEGNGKEIARALDQGERWSINLREAGTSRKLLEGVLRLEGQKQDEAMETLKTFGLIAEVGDEGLAQIRDILYEGRVSIDMHYAPYPQVIYGLDAEGRLLVAASSGLLDGRISGKSGPGIVELGAMAKEMGMVQAWIGSQGLDSPQVYKNGVNEAVEPIYGAEYAEKYGTRIDEKEATTPSVFIVVRNFEEKKVMEAELES